MKKIFFLILCRSSLRVLRSYIVDILALSGCINLSYSLRTFLDTHIFDFQCKIWPADLETRVKFQRTSLLLDANLAVKCCLINCLIMPRNSRTQMRIDAVSRHSERNAISVVRCKLIKDRPIKYRLTIRIIIVA